MKWVYDDGGRADAGYKGIAGDCVCRAFAIASGKPYKEVYKLINDLAKGERKYHSSSRTGVYKGTIHKVAEALHFVWHPCMKPGTGCKVHMRSEELPKGRIVCSLSQHCAAVIDGVLHDTYDSTREGTRCVYGYWVYRPVKSEN